MSKSNRVPTNVLGRIPLTLEELLEQLGCADIAIDETVVIQFPGIGSVEITVSECQLEKNPVDDAGEKPLKDDPTTITSEDMIRNFGELTHQINFEDYFLAKKLLEKGASYEFVSTSTSLSKDIVKFLYDEFNNQKKFKFDSDTETLTPRNIGTYLAIRTLNIMIKEIKLAEELLINGASHEFILSCTSLNDFFLNAIQDKVLVRTKREIKSHPLTPADTEIEIAKRMLENGASKEFVLKTTSLNDVTIEAFQKKFVN